MNFNNEIIIFILSGFIGYYIVWGITPSLHAPLMSVANAISGIIIIGAIAVLDESPTIFTACISFIAIVAAAINIFGGFAVSQRMLEMFKPRNKDKTDV